MLFLIGGVFWVVGGICGFIGLALPMPSALPLYFCSLAAIMSGTITIAAGEVCQAIKRAAQQAGAASARTDDLLTRLINASAPAAAPAPAPSERLIAPTAADEPSASGRRDDWPKPDWLKADR